MFALKLLYCLCAFCLCCDRLIFHKEGHGFPLCAVREIKFLKSLEHKNIVRLRDVITSKGCEHIERTIETNSNRDRDANGQPNKDPKGTEAIIGAGGAAGGISENDKDETAAGVASSSSSATALSAQKKSRKRMMDGFDYETTKTCGNLYFVFDFLEHDLSGLVDSKYKFSAREIKCIMKQLFEALDYLCEKRVLHRDIKTSNILISNYHQLKLADFGLARSISMDGRDLRSDLTNNVVTLWYKPPELLLGAVRYSFAVDVWSAGCVMAELELGRPMFPGKTETEELDLIFRTLGTPLQRDWAGMAALPNAAAMTSSLPVYQTSLRRNYTAKISEPALNFLERILVVDPSRRSSAKIALTNKYFVVQPLPPSDPKELGPLNVAAGVSYHEYKTKQQKRMKLASDSLLEVQPQPQGQPSQQQQQQQPSQQQQPPQQQQQPPQQKQQWQYQQQPSQQQRQSQQQQWQYQQPQNRQQYPKHPPLSNPQHK